MAPFSLMAKPRVVKHTLWRYFHSPYNDIIVHAASSREKSYNCDGLVLMRTRLDFYSLESFHTSMQFVVITAGPWWYTIYHYNIRVYAIVISMRCE